MTAMDFRRALAEIRWQSGLSPGFSASIGLCWSYLHARYALAPAGGNSRDPRRRGLPISGTKKTIGRERTTNSRAAFGGTERLRATLAISRHRPENRPDKIGHRRRKHAAGEGRFPGGSQERHHEDLREGRQDVRPGEERRRHLQYGGKESVFPRRRRNHPQSAHRGAAGQTTDRR